MIVNFLKRKLQIPVAEQAQIHSSKLAVNEAKVYYYTKKADAKIAEADYYKKQSALVEAQIEAMKSGKFFEGVNNLNAGIAAGLSLAGAAAYLNSELADKEFHDMSPTTKAAHDAGVI